MQETAISFRVQKRKETQMQKELLLKIVRENSYRKYKVKKGLTGFSSI